MLVVTPRPPLPYHLIRLTPRLLASPFCPLASLSRPSDIPSRLPAAPPRPSVNRPAPVLGPFLIRQPSRLAHRTRQPVRWPLSCEHLTRTLQRRMWEDVAGRKERACSRRERPKTRGERGSADGNRRGEWSQERWQTLSLPLSSWYAK